MSDNDPLLAEALFRQEIRDRLAQLETAHADLIRKLGYEDYQRRLFSMTQHKHKTAEIEDFKTEVSKFLAT